MALARRAALAAIAPHPCVCRDLAGHGRRVPSGFGEGRRPPPPTRPSGMNTACAKPKPRNIRGDGQKFTATAWRFQDPTGALGAFEWLRPADAKPSALAKLAAETPTGTILVHGNYVLRFEGYHPAAPFLATVVEGLKQVDNSSLPALIGLPAIPGPDAQFRALRGGPGGLAEIRSRDSPIHRGFPPLRGGPGGLVSDAAGGDLKLAIFSYPTPQIARQQTAEFQQIAGAMVKRSGPLVAVILSPPNPGRRREAIVADPLSGRRDARSNASTRAATTSATWSSTPLF